jgi:signal peptidase
MEPAIKTGAVVLLYRTDNYTVGNTITYGQSGDKPTTHRIVEVGEDNGVEFYTTKGDANKGPDFKRVYKNEVIGEVLLDVPFVGYVLAAAKTPLGLIFLIGIPGVWLISDEIRKIIKETKKIKNEKV